MIVNILLFPLNGSHRETARSMSAYAEGELGGYRRWRVTRHLARCEACRALQRAFVSTLASLRGLAGEDPPARPGFAGEIVAHVRAEGLDGAG